MGQEKNVGSFTVNVYAAHHGTDSRKEFVHFGSYGGKCTLDSVGYHIITVRGNG